ncbi:unnamed protein product [Peronospora destructor]|uniref:Uncharacterized protein n=1 Tax=Peronospora destructor TaxID=86335 RepID=A0AAV0T5C1_9STRA|nr:unnamed protein product [Peronospora destructor]
MDYSKTAPDASILNDYVKRTGCDDLTKIGTQTTLAEINSFSIYANCDSPVANITCFNVSGTDGTALKPGGVTINGMAKHTTFDSYIGSAEIYIAILSPDTVSLHRFGTSADTFNYTDANADIGTGVSVNGLQQLSFVTGFLSYMSGPFFIYDDLSLLEAVQMTSTDGTVMKADSMHDSAGNLLESVHSAYGIFVDIESGTGQTMSARKRLQILYALAASMYVPKASMSNVLWPTLPTEVVLLAYWVQEAGEAKDSVLDTFKSTLAFVKTFLQKLETQRYDSVI